MPPRHMHIPFVLEVWLVVLLCYSHVNKLSALVDVQVTSAGYSYTANFRIDSSEVDPAFESVQEILDTGSNQMLTYNQTDDNSDDIDNKLLCLALSVDGTTIDFYSDGQSSSCEVLGAKISVGGAAANANVTEAQFLYVQNPNLHQWQKGNGVIGLAYCNSCNALTTFQKLVQNASTDGDKSDDPFAEDDELALIFGLDFRDDNSVVNTDDNGSKYKGSAGSASSLQLGATSDEFAGSLEWLQQPDDTPDYHTFFLKDLRFCGAEPLGNYSRTWQVLVDTGAACLTLPSEIYDSFESWFDDDAVITDINNMPAFSFKLNVEDASTLYVPLSSLLLNASAIESEKGAPLVTISSKAAGLSDSDDDNGGVDMRLCVLRGSDVEYSDGDWIYPAPNIVFGSMALRGVYFAADFTSASVGLANKLTSEYISGLTMNSGGPGCSAVAKCEGDQNFLPWKNKCKDPGCDNYFFMRYNSDTKECEYNQNMITAGLFLIIFFTLLEVVSYFVTQYSAFSYLTGEYRAVAGGEQVLVPDTASTEQDYRRYCGIGTFDPLTIAVGKFLTLPVDALLNVICYRRVGFAVPLRANIEQQPPQQQRGRGDANLARQERIARGNAPRGVAGAAVGRGNPLRQRNSSSSSSSSRSMQSEDGSALINPVSSSRAPSDEFPRTPVS